MLLHSGNVEVVGKITVLDRTQTIIHFFTGKMLKMQKAICKEALQSMSKEEIPCHLSFFDVTPDQQDYICLTQLWLRFGYVYAQKQCDEG